MKKAYVNPELKFLSLSVEDVTNTVSLFGEGGALTLGQDDSSLSLNGDLSGLFGSQS